MELVRGLKNSLPEWRRHLGDMPRVLLAARYNKQKALVLSNERQVMFDGRVAILTIRPSYKAWHVIV